MEQDPLEGSDEPHEFVDSSRVIVPETRKRLVWLERTLKEAEGHATPRGTFRESKRPKKYSGYATLMCKIIEYEPSTLVEVAEHQVWRDAMVDEYKSMLKNDVWEIVPRPERKSVLSSKWIYKIKHATNGSIDK